MKLEGVMPALVTPIDENEKIRTDVLERLVAYFLDKGAPGFYIGGATGEGLALRMEERKVLAEAAVRAIDKKAQSIVQIANTDLNAAVELARHAQSVGADMISATPPIFFAYDENDVFHYYKKLAESVDIPLMMYYSPAAGFNISAKFAARIFREIENVTAIKWTNPNYHQMMQVKELTNGEMLVFNGPDEMLLMGLAAGADGGIGTTYNFMFENFKTVYDAFRAGDMATAQKYQRKISSIIAVLDEYMCIPATKVLMEKMGYEVGYATYPMKRYTEQEKESIVTAFEAAGWTC